jgi:hypothetical protein
VSGKGARLSERVKGRVELQITLDKLTLYHSPFAKVTDVPFFTPVLSAFVKQLPYSERMQSIGTNQYGGPEPHHKSFFTLTHTIQIRTPATERHAGLTPVFFPAIPGNERPQTHALDGAALGMGDTCVYSSYFIITLKRMSPTRTFVPVRIYFTAVLYSHSVPTCFGCVQQ